MPVFLSPCRTKTVETSTTSTLQMLPLAHSNQICHASRKTSPQNFIASHLHQEKRPRVYNSRNPIHFCNTRSAPPPLIDRHFPPLIDTKLCADPGPLQVSPLVGPTAALRSQGTSIGQLHRWSGAVSLEKKAIPLKKGVDRVETWIPRSLHTN